MHMTKSDFNYVVPVEWKFGVGKIYLFFQEMNAFIQH